MTKDKDRETKRTEPHMLAEVKKLRLRDSLKNSRAILSSDATQTIF